MNGNQPGVQLIESEEDKKKKGQATQPGSAFAPTGPSAPSAPSGTQQARAAQAAGPTRGTGFTGVGRFLQANVGSRLGQEVAGRVSQAGQQAASRLGQAAGQFQQQLGQKQQELSAQQQASQAALQRIAGKDPSKPSQRELFLKQKDFERSLPPMSSSLNDKYSDYQKIIYNINRQVMPMDFGPGSANERAEKAMATQRDKALQDFLAGLNPEERAEYDSRQYNPQKQIQLTPSQEEVAAYQAIAGGQIQAPTGLQDVEDVRAQAALAGKLAKGTQTTAGRTGLLQQVVGRGPRQYTAGQSALDALILGQAGGQLAAARRASAGLGRQVETQSRLAEEQARQFGLETQRAKEAITGEATGIEKKTTSDIEAQKAQYESGLSDLSETIKSEIKSGELSQKTANILKNLGIDPSSRFYGLPLDQIANLVATKDPATFTSSAKAEQLKRINALKQLAGKGSQFSEEELEKAGTTLDPETGFRTTQNVAELQSKEREKYEQNIARLLGGSSETSIWTPYEQFEQLRSDPRLRMFQYSPGKGDIKIAQDLANRVLGGQLYDKETGALNVDLANELKSFWSWRPKYMGQSGLFGRGEYEKYSEDAARVAALEDLIKRSGPAFKIKPE